MDESEYSRVRDHICTYLVGHPRGVSTQRLRRAVTARESALDIEGFERVLADLERQGEVSCLYARGARVERGPRWYTPEAYVGGLEEAARLRRLYRSQQTETGGVQPHAVAESVQRLLEVFGVQCVPHVHDGEVHLCMSAENAQELERVLRERRRG